MKLITSRFILLNILYNKNYTHTEYPFYTMHSFKAILQSIVQKKGAQQYLR